LRRPTERNVQLLRLLQIIRDLDRLGGIDIYELAERYGTSVRTIRRDLDALQTAGLPVIEESSSGSRRKTWRIAYGDQLRRLSDLVDVSHYLALRATMRSGGALGGSSSLFASLEDLCDKIEHALGPKERTRLQTIEQAFHSHEKFAYHRAAPDVFWPIIEAIAEWRICTVTYRPPTPTSERSRFRILPLRMFAHEGAVYLHACVPRYGDVVTLNLHRLEKLKVTQENGTPPSTYNSAKWEASAFGIHSGGTPTTYRLRFEAWAAPYIRERVWHPTQKLRELTDSRLDLTFTCGESYEVTAWVASWREAVEALEPEGLRRELAELAKHLGEMYGSKRGIESDVRSPQGRAPLPRRL